ncbi:MAG: ComF family protein [Solobacterium sp.]|nr:ComF family protein [Solobacterium sp.]
MRCLLCDGIKERTGLYDALWSEDPLCQTCRSQWQRKDIRFKVDGVPLYSCYVYNEAFSSCLIQYKECMDEALAPVFLYGLKEKLRRMYRGYTIVLMPSSASRIRERGFHHLEKIFAPLGLPVVDAFEKLTDTPQKSMRAEERENIRNLIRLKEGIRLPRRIVLADDTMTTGATIRAALSKLDRKRHRIRIFTISVNPRTIPDKLPFPADIAIINKSASAGKRRK